MEPRLVLAIVDRIAHSSTTALDREQSVAALQRVLHGKMPSDVLGAPDDDEVPTARPKYRSYDTCQKEINDLKAKLKDIETERNVSERQRKRQIEGLIAEIAKLQAELDRHRKPRRKGETFTHAEVCQAMVEKFGKHHGVPAALVDRNERLIVDDPSIGAISDSLMTMWRSKNAYPAYVIEQINAMSKDDLLPRTAWSEEERMYLRALYTKDPKQPDRMLAHACSQEFGRRFTIRSIKGELSRMRRKGIVTYRLQ